MMKNTVSGVVFNTQHYSVHDGPGIRTVVFFKGCRLHCRWCSNPESQLPFLQLSYQEKNCIGLECRRCEAMCSQKALKFSNSAAEVDWSRCNHCQKCVTICPSQALETFGANSTVQELLTEVEEDSLFYRRSKGGLTLSGGEVCLQPEFAVALLKQAKSQGIDTAMETCGYAPWEAVQAVGTLCDHIFFDIKHMDSKKHEAYTGVSNEQILENFRKLVEQFPQKDITVRTPVIPGFNATETEIHQIEQFLSQTAPHVKYELLKYHRFGEEKYRCLGRTYQMGAVDLSDEEFAQIKNSVTFPNKI